MNLIKSEIRKFTSTAVWFWLLIGTVILALLPVVLTLSFAGQQGRGGQPGLPKITSPQIQTFVLTGPTSASIFVAILGVIGITAEYRHRTVTPTFLTTPRRWKVIVAKLITYTAVGVLYAAVAAIFVVLVAMIWINAAGGNFSLGGDNWKVLVGAALSTALYGIVGVGVGALIRNQIAAVVGLLAYLFVIENILRSISSVQGVYKFLPGGATQAMTTYTTLPGTDDNLLSPVQGGIVLVLYGLLFAGLALMLSTRREVS